MVKRTKKVSKTTIKKKVKALKKAASTFRRKARDARATFSKYQRYISGTRGVLAPNARIGRVVPARSSHTRVVGVVRPREEDLAAGFSGNGMVVPYARPPKGRRMVVMDDPHVYPDRPGGA